MNDYVCTHASPLDACLWRAVGRCPRQHLQEGHLPPAPLATQQELSCMNPCPALTWTHNVWSSPRLGTAAAGRRGWEGKSLLPFPCVCLQIFLAAIRGQKGRHQPHGLCPCSLNACRMPLFLHAHPSRPWPHLPSGQNKALRMPLLGEL